MSIHDTIGEADPTTHYHLFGGAFLLAAPIWVTWLEYVSVVASAVAGVCGAILGVHAVCRLVARSRRRSPDRG